MKVKTVNEIRRLGVLFLLCMFGAFLVDAVYDLPLWIDIIIVLSFTLPINLFVLGRLDVEEI